jgi:hypothetical protein
MTGSRPLPGQSSTCRLEISFSRALVSKAQVARLLSVIDAGSQFYAARRDETDAPSYRPGSLSTGFRGILPSAIVHALGMTPR